LPAIHSPGSAPSLRHVVTERAIRSVARASPRFRPVPNPAHPGSSSEMCLLTGDHPAGCTGMTGQIIPQIAPAVSSESTFGPAIYRYRSPWRLPSPGRGLFWPSLAADSQNRRAIRLSIIGPQGRRVTIELLKTSGTQSGSEAGAQGHALRGYEPLRAEKAREMCETAKIRQASTGVIKTPER
jgi:hypothetical protein